MDGGIFGTGILSHAKRGSEYEMNKILDLKIKDLVIHSIPLSTSKVVTGLRTVGTVLSGLFHPALTPTLCHTAIQLNMENGEIIIIEYGQFPTEDDTNEKEEKFSNSDSLNNSINPKGKKNENIYYYINKDGARLTQISKKYYKNHEHKAKNGSIITAIIAAQIYGEDIESFIKNCRSKNFKKDNNIDGYYNCFHRVQCDVKNKISLRELCRHFKGEKWEAEKYNIATHNCQKFSAKIIKILKAVRIHESDKIRTKEKITLPNCIISALWDNEELSSVNTIGRIPIIGLIYDSFYAVDHYK